MKHGMTKKLYLCFGRKDYDSDVYCTAYYCATSFDEAKYYFEKCDVRIYGINFIKQLAADTDIGILEISNHYYGKSKTSDSYSNREIEKLTMKYYMDLMYLLNQGG